MTTFGRVQRVYTQRVQRKRTESQDNQSRTKIREKLNLVDVSDIFYLFSALGRGKGESEAPGGGGGLFAENPRRGGLPGGWGRGGERPGGC